MHLWNPVVDQMEPHFSSVQFIHSVVSDSLWPHGLQHTRLPCLDRASVFSQKTEGAGWPRRRSPSIQFSSVQFSHSVMSDSLWPHELQHAKPPCPSPTSRVHTNLCPSSWWCHPAISSSVVPFSSCPHPSQHQSLFQWVNSSHEVAKVLEFQL